MGGRFWQGLHAMKTPRTSWLLITFLVAMTSLARAAAPSLQITPASPSGGTWVIGWTAAGTGLVYTVQSADSPVDGPWLLPRAQHPWPISARTWQDTRIAPCTMRFYRVLAVPEAQRGKVLSSTLAGTLSTAEIGFLLSLAGSTITPQYSVQLHKVVYETIDPNGARTWASGAMVLPVGAGHLLPMVSYQHGTIARSNDAPSSMDFGGEVTIGVAFATTGYAAVVPDYLGLGDSVGQHPYQHARSEATCGVDMLRALRTLCTTNGFPLTNRLFLCGYSQGGHATMALARELEDYHTNEFTLTACAPMAGAYDMSGATTADFLSGRLQPNPYYFALLLAAYQDVYRLAPTLADLLVAPYAATLPPLLQGGSTGEEINSVMPRDPTLILKPEILAAFRQNPNHPLRQALRDNDVYAWKPRSPMRLYHCSGDQDVAFTNSQVALASFQSRGAQQVSLINTVPGGTHGSCVLPSLQAAKAWFDSLR
jgi:pimeloyl-ACP methyl ester carboxylesterase